MNKPSFTLRLPSRRRMQSAARDLLLYRYRTIGIALVLFGIIMNGLLIFSFFFTSSTEVSAPAALPDRSLHTTAIDELEVWIEARQTAYENPPGLAGRAYFADTLPHP